MEAKYHVQKAVDYLETLEAIMVLEYHDKNYLDTALTANPNKMNMTQRNLIQLAEQELDKAVNEKSKIKKGKS